MRILTIFYFILASSLAFCASPWDLDSQTRQQLQTQIEAKHQQRFTTCHEQGISYFIDYDRTRLNFYIKDHPECQNLEKREGLEEKLVKAGFKKKPHNDADERKAHCFGATVLFIKHLLTQPHLLSESCSKILSEVANDPNFRQAAYALSRNQHVDFYIDDASELVELKTAAMKEYFQIIMEETPADYYFQVVSPSTNSSFDKETIFATLKNLPGKLVVIGYETSKGSSHCIAVSTHPKKFLYFNSNDGLYQYADLETLSFISSKVLNGGKFRWLATFPIE